jgi:hypothetical protein
MRPTVRTLLGLIAIALLGLAIPAQAAEVTRDSYREAVEPICKTDTEANERIFAGVRDEVKQGKLKPAARQFEKAARALKRALAQLRTVPRPSADAERLDKWFREVGKEVDLFEATAAKLRAGKKFAAERMVVKLSNQAEIANRVVVAFEFQYCRLEPSRFT